MLAGIENSHCYTKTREHSRIWKPCCYFECQYSTEGSLAPTPVVLTFFFFMSFPRGARTNVLRSRTKEKISAVFEIFSGHNRNRCILLSRASGERYFFVRGKCFYFTVGFLSGPQGSVWPIKSVWHYAYLFKVWVWVSIFRLVSVQTGLPRFLSW